MSRSFETFSLKGLSPEVLESARVVIQVNLARCGLFGVRIVHSVDTPGRHRVIFAPAADIDQEMAELVGLEGEVRTPEDQELAQIRTMEIKRVDEQLRKYA